MDIQKIRTLLGLSADRPLSPEEKRRRTRYIVYPAMCLLFAGSLWLIYSPLEKERAAEEKEKGFNTDIPSPGQQRMDGNKVDAYEREELEKKDKYRKNAFQEMASLFGSSGKDTVHLPEGMAELPVEEADNPSTGSHNTVHSSAGAYRNMNRTLDNFYTRAENSERNELLRRIEELEHERQMKKPSQETTMEEKMALMEKSYELAQELMRKYPDLELIAGMNEYSAVGVGRAVSDAGAKDKIAVVGVDCSQEAINLMEMGVYKGIIVQKAFRMGYIGVEETIHMLNGDAVEKNIDSGCELVTPENMYNSDIERLIFPFS